MQPDPEHPTLSPRQAQIFAMLAEGRTQEEIAPHLNISEQAVKQYAQAAKAKFGARTMIEAVVKADRAGLIPVVAVNPA